MLSWRLMLPEDLPSVSDLANAIHASLPESPEIFAERLSLFPSGCFRISQVSSNKVQGYIISHPIHMDRPPALNQPFGSIPAGANAYYIHDLVVSPDLRGQGHAAQGVEKAVGVSKAEGYGSVCLISVYGTSVFWEKFGFERHSSAQVVLMEKLKAYGDDAVFMTKTIQP